MKKKTVRAWMMIDTRRAQPRPCYAAATGTQRHTQGFAAVFLHRPPKSVVSGPWSYVKKIVPVTITYELPTKRKKA